jgi:predicted SpoU family rRNA methylase
MGLLAVFRLGHRVQRDKRLTTHVALVARAFGADKMFYSGDKDTTVEKTVENGCEKVGRRLHGRVRGPVGGHFSESGVEPWYT